MTNSQTLPFDIIETHFRQLGNRLSIDGSAIDVGVPQRALLPGELAAMVLHPATSFDTRDAIVRAVIERCLQDDGWYVVLVGILLPGLRSRVSAIVATSSTYRPDMEADVLAECASVLAVFDAQRSRVAARLVWRVVRKPYRNLQRERTMVSKPLADEHGIQASLDRPRHGDLALHAAVVGGVINATDAELIGATRLEQQDLRVLAQKLAVPYETLRKRRLRAERKLLAHLKDCLSQNEPPDAV